MSPQVCMDSMRMRPEEVATCRWIGWTITKGVIHPERKIVAWADEGTGVSQQHGHLIQRFSGVDACPRCYDRDAAVGFGGFVRVNRFTHPSGSSTIFGVDWSRVEPAVIGVATSVLRVAQVAALAALHGTRSEDELVLLGWTMCETPDRQSWRQHHGLVAVGDWANALYDRFAPGSPHYPACAERTMEPGFKFCHQCGCDPRDIHGGK